MSRPMSVIRAELLAAHAEASTSVPFAPRALVRLVDLIVEGIDVLSELAPEPRQADNADQPQA